MRVPVEEQDVFASHLDEARADFREPPREQATEAEATDRPRLVVAVAVQLRGVDARGIESGRNVFREALARLEREVERLGRGRAEEPVRVVHRAHE